MKNIKQTNREKTRGHMEYIRELVGDIREEDLKYVDYYVWEKVSIFIPSVGYCGYAIKENHTHPAYSFIILNSNKQKFTDNKINSDRENYTALALSPDVKHTEETEADDFNRYIAIFIDKEYFEDIVREQGYTTEIYNWTEFKFNKFWIYYIDEFISEYEGKLKGDTKVLESLAYLLTNKIIRELNNKNTLSRVRILKSDIKDIIQYINEEYNNDISLDSLSLKFNRSKSNIIKLFKEEINLTPIQYINKLRIEKSKKLLRCGSMSITEIALNCGFASNSYFSTSFIKEVGVTPTEYFSMHNK